MNEDASWMIAFPGRDAFDKGLSDSFYKGSAIARDVFTQASAYFKKNLHAVCYEYRCMDEKWKSIALAVHCFSAYQTLKNNIGSPTAFAGYSQGEFVACAAAGVFDFLPMLGLLYRLETILEQGNTSEQCMYRIIGLDAVILEQCCAVASEDGQYVCISAYLSEDQNVVSGEVAAVRKAIQLAKEKGARWALLLYTGRGFHSPLCTNAYRQAIAHFNRLQAFDALASVFQCLDGTCATEGKQIREKLSMQVNHPLQWKKLIEEAERMEITSLIEIGPGCTVSANTRIAARYMECRWINTMEDMEI